MERATTSHLRRLRYNLRQMELLPEHRVLINDTIVDYAISGYAEVRR